MLFHELYGYYYQAIQKILCAALQHEITSQEIRTIINETAFSQSYVSIEPALQEGLYPFLDASLHTPLNHVPTRPLTLLEKRWIKAMLLDPKAALFPITNSSEFSTYTPLYKQGDIVYFDQYFDSDPFQDSTYIKHFHTILQALHQKRKLYIVYISRNGERIHNMVSCVRLEYSLKDDKFRLQTTNATINLTRICSCSLRNELAESKPRYERQASLTLELVDERNALDRVMLHFAHYEKQAEKLDDQHYRMKIMYDQQDETEVLIRILSFGPMVKVIAPDHFIQVIKERLIMQKGCGQT